MKKKNIANIALVVLLALGSAVLAASMVMVVVPQMKSGTDVDVSESTKIIQEEIQQRIDQYTEKDAAQDSIVKENLERTQEIVDEAQEIAGLK